MKFRTLALSVLVPTLASMAFACGGAADAANKDLADPAHVNESPTVGDGGAVDTTNADLAKPASVNQSPDPTPTKTP